MLKRIAVSDLRLGMHLHEFCGSWLEHPFFRSAFVLRDPEDLQRIVDYGIREVWIDSSKGLDIAPERRKPESDTPVERELGSMVTECIPAENESSFADEILRAGRICAHASQTVRSIFNEARLGNAVSATDALPLIEEITKSIIRNPVALISLARLTSVDSYTYMHSVAVSALMIALARQMGFDESLTREAGLAGLFHDIGKVTIPAEILTKPGRLTDNEVALIKEHPAKGYQLLRNNNTLSDVVLDVCLHHHEKSDSSGYPDRLSNDGISQFAKMGAVCDVYDAITSDRPYKRGWNPADAMRKMTEWSNGHFEKRVFHAFVKTVGIYPVGSLVRMHSGRVGVVVEPSEKSLLTPKVKIFFSTKSNARIPPEVIDTSLQSCRDKIASCENPDHWSFPDIIALWAG